jgi:hypothetical protein
LRAWLTETRSAADAVAERPALWLPGALAWTATVGWLALVIGVAPSPTAAELTFLGARIVTSGSWPWNLVVGVAAMSLVILVAFLLAAAGEAVLLRGRRASIADVARLAAIGLVCAVPTAVALAATVVVAAGAAPGEFNAPEPGPGPLARTVLLVAPLLAAAVLAAAAGAAFHAAAARGVAAGRGVTGALRDAPPALAGAGAGAVMLAATLLVARVAYVALAAVLLRVLWAPIDLRLESEGIGLGAMLLLVGFVAIWLCLVLGGGALQAWGSAAWTRVLRASSRRRGGADGERETDSRP